MTVELPRTLELETLVSWDGSGDFDGDYDDVTDDVAVTPGVTLTLGRQDSLTLSPPRVQDGRFDLHNEQGTYSQERADSPVYQRVIPGRPVLYRCRFGVEGVYDEAADYDEGLYYDGLGTFSLGRHLIRDIGQQVALGDQRVSLTTLGYEYVLTRATVTVGVTATPLVSECFTALLDAVGWPADKRDISVSDTRLLWWWCDDREPWAAMLELLAAEGPGTFYVDRDGVFHFENRNYRTTTERCMTSQATFYDRVDAVTDTYPGDDPYPGVTSGLWFTAFSYDPGFKNVYNRATYTTRRRLAGPTAAIWSYGENLALSSGQTLTLVIRPTSPFQNAVTPVAPTDYTVSGGTVSVSLSATSGLVAFLTITATSGTPTLSNLQVRGDSLAALGSGDVSVANSIDASASIAKFSPVPGEDVPIPLALGGWPEIDVPNAVAVCNAWVSRYMVQRPAVSITVRNADGLHLEQILRRRVSDRITLVEANTGISADFWINALKLTVADAQGKTVTLEVSAELCDSLTGAIWDLSEWDDPSAVWGI